MSSKSCCQAASRSSSSGRELGEPPVDVAEAFAPQRKGSAVIRREPDDPGKGLVPAEIILAGVPPGVLAHGSLFFHRGPEEVLAVTAVEQEDETLQVAA